jgi:V-type H+-transporting ATPase subunit a
MKLSSRLLFQLNENVNTFQRKFVNEVRRCGEMERKLRYIETEVKKDKVSIPDVQELPKAPNPTEIIDLEVLLSCWLISC